jgi:hypothetical protein
MLLKQWLQKRTVAELHFKSKFEVLIPCVYFIRVSAVTFSFYIPLVLFAWMKFKRKIQIFTQLLCLRSTKQFRLRLPSYSGK